MIELMSENWKLCILGPEKTQFVEVRGLLAIGGQKSTGITVPGLKHSDDYMILSPNQAGVSIHCLKGRKNKNHIQLLKNEHFQLLDLVLLLLPSDEIFPTRSFSDNSERFADDIRVLVQKFSQPGDLKGTMEILIETMLATFQMDKGLVIASNNDGEFKVLAQENISMDEPWLSESLVQKTMTTQKPTILQNIIGSPFESSQSLIGIGFMSVCAWPLTVRGQVLGVLMIGAERPHSGLNSSQKSQAEAFVHLAALMLKFYLNDISLKKEMETLRQSYKENHSPFSTIDENFKEKLQIVEQLSDTNLTLLIQGETGSGKELMAKWIHQSSSRHNNAFIAVNCGAIPSELLESLLFGHKKGAFTGAIKDQLGKFQQAHRGTLFLDEIGDLSGPLQVKILRVLQERCVEPLGAEKGTEVDVRVLCATHHDLKKRVDEGLFRQDLYYRLAEATFEIPPLRQRPEDISLIARSILKEQETDKYFSSEAMQWLQVQPWKGNTRELISTIKRALALCGEKEIQIHHMTLGAPQESHEAQPSWLGGKNLDDAKNNFVYEKTRLALRKTKNNKTKAAELLGITPRTLFRYLENSNL